MYQMTEKPSGTWLLLPFLIAISLLHLKFLLNFACGLRVIKIIWIHSNLKMKIDSKHEKFHFFCVCVHVLRSAVIKIVSY